MVKSCRPCLLCFLAFFSLCNKSFSQVIDLGLNNWRTSIESPYRLDVTKDIVLSATSLAMIGAGQLIKAKKKDIPDSVLLFPDISKIPAFDRRAIHQHSAIYLSASDILEYTSMVLPFISFVDKRVNGHGPQIAAMFLETLALDAGMYAMTTGIVNRRRPLTYNTDTNMVNGVAVPEVSFGEKHGKTVRESFFSGHTCNAAASTFFGATIFTTFRPQSKLVPFVWGAAAFVPAFVGFSRYKAGKHFPSDVVTGYIVGASIGFLVPTLHRMKTGDQLSIYPTFDQGEGFSMTYTF